MKLSILIPTLPERQHFLNELLECIIKQANKEVEILTDSTAKPTTTGEKRNDLLFKASGEYTWFVDDDDLILPGAIAAIFKAIESKPDVIGINGFMTVDGIDRTDFEIRLNHPYCETRKYNRRYYLRYPNHITPMKREIAVQVKFPHITIQEDYQWATALKNKGLLQTQVVIDEPVYHYRFRSKLK